MHPTMSGKERLAARERVRLLPPILVGGHGYKSGPESTYKEASRVRSQTTVNAMSKAGSSRKAYRNRTQEQCGRECLG